jgi:hypothetical protein
MLENPVYPGLLASEWSEAVTMLQVRKTSRKVSDEAYLIRESSETIRRPSFTDLEEDEMVRSLWRRREAGGNDQPASRG